MRPHETPSGGKKNAVEQNNPAQAGFRIKKDSGLIL